MKKIILLVAVLLLSACSTKPEEPAPWFWTPPQDLTLIQAAYPAQPGLIQGFGTAQNETSVTIDGNPCLKHNQNTAGAKPYAVSQLDDFTLRFEVRNGDKWIDPTNGTGDENNNANRSEVHCYGRQYAAGVPVIWSYDIRFIIPLSTSWNVLGQNHDSGGSPPVAMQGSGSNMDGVWRTPNFMSSALLHGFELNTWYNIRVETNNANNGTGYVRFYLNDLLRINYIGPVGDGESTWLNWGIYRDAASSTSIVDYRNMIFRLASDYPTQLPPTPTGTAQEAPGTLVQTTPTSLAGLYWEAEQGAIDAPFQAVNGLVSQNILSTNPTAAGRAAYRFTLADAGNYYIQAVVNAANAGSNSFFVNIDAEPNATMIWDIPPTTGLEQRLVSWRESGSPEAYPPAKVFSLTAGEHTLIVRGREVNTMLDSLQLVAVSDLTPTPSPTATRSLTPSQTPSRTATVTQSPTKTATQTSTPTASPTIAPTQANIFLCPTLSQDMIGCYRVTPGE